MEKQRLQKLLASAGVASRRKCEELIAAGKVTVNGEVAKVGQSATSDDDIRVAGKSIAIESKVYVMLNKPAGVTSTVSDSHATRTVTDLVKLPQRVFPVGRLDKESEGLMLLTNDGELMQRLTHPSYEVRKTYEVVTARQISEDDLAALRAGVVIEGRKAKPDAVERLGPVTARIVIHEGRKHIIRLMMAKIEHTVVRLTRLAIGPLTLRELKPGQWRPVRPEELERLKA